MTGELATLRRLYHHMVNGGKVTADDERRTGISPMTPESLSRRIGALERQQAADDAACCHKTRLAGSGCPIGRYCPYDDHGHKGTLS